MPSVNIKIRTRIRLNPTKVMGMRELDTSEAAFLPKALFGWLVEGVCVGKCSHFEPSKRGDKSSVEVT